MTGARGPQDSWSIRTRGRGRVGTHAPEAPQHKEGSFSYGDYSPTHFRLLGQKVHESTPPMLKQLAPTVIAKHAFSPTQG